MSFFERIALAFRVIFYPDALGRLKIIARSCEKTDSIQAQKESALRVQIEKQSAVELRRLKLLSKFAGIAEKAREVELEWQRIQQDEHDFQFAFHTSKDEESQAKYLYKKGIADGVKWCLNLFS